MRLPSGISETSMSLKFAMPSGMPMMVKHIATPVTTCPRASHQPQDVAQQGHHPGIAVAHQPPAEREQREAGHPERSDSKILGNLMRKNLTQAKCKQDLTG